MRHKSCHPPHGKPVCGPGENSAWKPRPPHFEDCPNSSAPSPVAPVFLLRYIQKNMSYSSLPAGLLRAVDQHPSPRAQMFRTGERWEAISSQELLRRISGLANSLVELGVKSGDRVGLLAPTVPSGTPPILQSVVPARSPYPFILTNPPTA